MVICEEVPWRVWEWGVPSKVGLWVRMSLENRISASTVVLAWPVAVIGRFAP